MNNRRSFIKKVALGALASSGAAQGAGRLGQSALEKKRLELRHAKRRLLWNNDGSDMLQPAFAGAKFPIPIESLEQFLGNTMRFVEGTQINSILYCAHVNQPEWEFPTRYMEVLGQNPVRHVVDFSHQQGMEFFYSIRMNDVHCSRYAPKASYWPPFKLKNPHLLIGYISAEHWREKVTPWIERFMAIEEERWQRKLYDPAKERELLRQSELEHPLADVIRRDGTASRDLWFWAGYDWARPEVRARYLEVIEGACQRYDLDGIELDWARHYRFFKLGEEARHIPVMNDFVRQVRQRLDYYGERRGRPILLASGRTPDSMAQSLALGLDPETWLREGWIDLLLAGSGGLPFTIPIREWVELGRRYEVPVYGCLDRIYVPFQTGRPKWDVRDPELGEELAENYEAVDAACYRFWEAGVSGISLYDWHTHHGPTRPEDYGVLPAIEDPAKLAGRNKLYRVDPGYARLGCLADGCLPSQLPRAFTTQSGPAAGRFQLEIADDPGRVSAVAVQVQYSAPQPAGSMPIASWELEKARATDPARFHWKLNGTALSGAQPAPVKRYGGYGTGWVVDEGWVELKASPRDLRRGINRLEVSVDRPRQGDPALPVIVSDLRLRLGLEKGV